MIIEYLPSILSVAGLMIVALVSPGPDFAIVVKNSLLYSRKTALLTAFGIALGIMVHIAYILLGLGIVISKTVWLFSLFKYVGAGYLIYIGYCGLKAKKKTSKPMEEFKPKSDISAFSAIGIGFFTNALNPKAMMFFLSLFSVLISPETPHLIMGIYAAIIFIATLGWFSFVAICLSSKKARKHFDKIGHWVNRVTGGILVALGLKLLFVKNNNS